MLCNGVYFNANFTVVTDVKDRKGSFIQFQPLYNAVSTKRLARHFHISTAYVRVRPAATYAVVSNHTFR